MPTLRFRTPGACIHEHGFLIVLTHVVRWAMPHRTWIVRHRFLRWVIRRILTIYREGSVTAVCVGEARGLRWRRSKHNVVAEYWLGTFEPMVQQTIAQGLSHGDAFFDVGSNSGFHTLVGARAVGSAGLVVAIEPDPEYAAEIECQAALNGFDHVTVVRKAVVADLSEPSLPGNGDAVTPTTIDQLAREFGPPTLIKIDVEGLELEVLRGAVTTLREHRPIVVVEAHSSELAGAISARLAMLGYHSLAFPAPYGPEFHIVAKPT